MAAIILLTGIKGLKEHGPQRVRGTDTETDWMEERLEIKNKKREDCHFHWDHMYPQLQVSCGSTVQSEEKSIWTDSWDAKLWEFPTCRRITLSICLTNKALCNTFWCNTGKLWRHHNLIAAVGGLLRSNTNINKTVAAADLNHYVGIKKDALGFFYFYRPVVFL